MSLNFFRIQKGLHLTAQASAPSSPLDGDMYYNSTTGKLVVRENGAWVSFASSAGGYQNGGNTFGGNASIGLSDNFALSFLTNNTTQGSISAAGLWTVGASGGTQVHVVNGSLSSTVSNTATAFIPSGSSVPSNGIYLPGANRVGFANNTTASAEFDANGHLNLLGQRELRLQDTTGGEYVGLKASGTQSTYTITLPASAPATDTFLKYDGANYVWATSGGGVTTVGSFGSSPTANAATISGSTITLQPADGSNPGAVSTAAQSLAGVKTFTSRMGVGTADSFAALSVKGTGLLSGSLQIAVWNQMTYSSAATDNDTSGFATTVTTENASFTTGHFKHFNANQITKGASNTITRLSGLYINSAAVSAGSNNAYISDNNSFSGDWAINFTNTRASSLGGTLTAASFIPSSSTAPTNGVYLPAANTVGISTNSTQAFKIDGSQNIDLGPSGGTGVVNVNAQIIMKPYSGTIAGVNTTGTANRLVVSSQTNASAGGVIDLYGSTHATLANTIDLSTNGSAALHVDASQNINVTGNFAISTAGKGLQVKEGSNAKMGTATLSSGAATVSTTAVTANSRIFLTVQSLGTVTTPKAIAVTAKTAATSFVITSEDGTDTSVVAWMIVEPA